MLIQTSDLPREAASRRTLSPRTAYALAALSLPAIAGGLVVGRLGVLATFELFGSIVTALALAAALQAWRTRPPTHRTHHRLAYQTTR